MTRLLAKLSPEWMLRLGLGAMFVYSGSDLFLHPTGWHWAIVPLPQFFQDFIAIMGETTFLKIQGITELIFAAVFLLWFVPRKYVRLVAFIASVEMIAILVMVGLDIGTFRDLGVLGASLGLTALLARRG